MANEILTNSKHLMSSGMQSPSVDNSWIEIDGIEYGAQPDIRGPIGGGENYIHTFTTGDYTPTTLDELITDLTNASSGEVVFIDENIEIDCTAMVFTEDFSLEIPEGITLAGNRGVDDSSGAIIYSDAFDTLPLICTLGTNVRITGLQIRGPDTKSRREHHARSFPDYPPTATDEQYTYFYLFPISDGIHTEFANLEVDNCEISGWSHAGIKLIGTGETTSTGHILHHNYIHHNQRHGNGYGIEHYHATSLIEYNIFNYNRHSIMGMGYSDDGYEARHNVLLGNYPLNHNFDMHGRSGVAGGEMKIHHNTMCYTGAPFVGIGGTPVTGASIYNNWVAHEQADEDFIIPWPTGGETGVTLENNIYGTQDV